MYAIPTAINLNNTKYFTTQFCGKNKTSGTGNSELKNILGHKNLSLLNEIKNIGKDSGSEIYLFGGCVRDCIVGKKPHDIDIIVNGDALNFARNLHNTDSKTFKQIFLKPSVKRAVVYTNGTHIDIKSLDTNGTHLDGKDNIRCALLKSIRTNDFTINSMIIKVGEDRSGKIKLKFIDILGGKKDLKENRLKMITSEVFKKDPIQALRGIRFLAKYRMKTSPETMDTIKNSFEGKFNKINLYYYRVFREYYRILKTIKNPIKFLMLLKKYNGFKALKIFN